MDELSPLFQDIEFRERLRGYDVAEVDAYIERVARAAALVHGRITELQQRADAAEARLVRPGTAPAVEPAIVDSPDPEQSMSRMLAIAQRTADAAIVEAEADAARMRAEADDHASRVLAEAETDRRRLIAEAERDAAATATELQARVAAEIGELEEYRAFLADDIEILETHLTDARLTLATSLSGLTDLLEQPEAFRVPAMPAVSGALAPTVLDHGDHEEAEDAAYAVEEDAEAGVPDLPSSTMESEEVVGTDPAETPLGDCLEPALTDGSTGFGSPDEVHAVAPEDRPQARPAPLFAPQPVPAMTLGSADDMSDDDVFEKSTAEPVEQPDPVGAIDLTPMSIDLEEQAAEPPLLVTAADLGTSGSDENGHEIGGDGGPITQPVPAIAAQPSVFEPEAPTLTAEPFLEQLREAVADPEFDRFDDDAISAFFDTDQEQGSRSWFSRRR